MQEKNFETIVVESVEAYRNCKFKNDQISEKLINLIDDEIKEAFESAFGFNF